MKNYFIKFWPILFIFFLWFIFASPYFLKGKVPYSSTYQVNFFPPWSHYKEFWGPVKNNAMPDVHTQIYPWKKFTIETLKNWQVPLWNPYSFSGNPHLANFQSAVLSPFNFLFLLLPLIDAWSILILLQPLLAGIFMYLLMREFKVSERGSVISSVTFMFCGFMVVWMAYGTLSMAISFLPLAVFAIERAFNKLSIFPLVTLSLALPLSFFSGHFQTSLYFVVLSLSFLIFKALITKKSKETALVALFFVLGMMLTLPQVLPSIEFYAHSVRKEIFIKSGGIPLYYLVNVFAPDFFGNPVTRNDWFGYYAEWASFIGIIPLTLAIFAIVKRKNYLPVFFFFAGIISLILSLDSPLQALIGGLKIPVLSTSDQSRIIVLFSFSFTVLAGFGLDSLGELISRKEVKKVASIFLILGLLFLLIWSLLLLFKILPSDKLLIAQRNFILSTLLLLGLAFVAFFNVLLQRRKFLLLSSYLLILLASFDSFRFAQKWMPLDPGKLVYPPVPVVAAMRKNIGDGRIYGNLGAEVSTYYGIPLIEGYDPLYIGRYGEFIRSAQDGEFLEGERSVVKLDRRGKYTDRALDLLGVSLIFHPTADTNTNWAFPVWKDKNHFSLVYEDDKFRLYKNNTQLPRASLFYDYEVVKDDKQIIKEFYSPDFNFREKLILEQEAKGNIKEGTGSARIVEYSPNKVSIQVETTTPGFLFLSDNYYPGWTASIDGQETKIYRADYSFRAVVMPSGVHRVEFIYESLSFNIGLWLSGGTLLLLTIVNLFLFLGKSR